MSSGALHTSLQPLDVGRDRELLAVVEVRAVVGQDESDLPTS